MLLSILAAVLHGIAYVIYMCQIHGGSSVPNPATWTVGAFIAILNAITFWKGTKDPAAAAQFFMGTVAAVVLWVYTLAIGKFAPLDWLSWTVMALAVVACIVWYVTKKAAYASPIMGGIILLIVVPTVIDLWQDGSKDRALPWYLWTLAFVITLVNTLRRIDRAKAHWRLMLVVPIVGIVVHAAVAILARG